MKTKNALWGWLLWGVMALPAGAESLLKPDDRILFAGDSITAIGIGHPQGYYHQFVAALHRVHPAYQNELIALGFSGRTLFDWADLEVRSRTQSVLTDDKRFDVREAFAKPAGIVFVLLGMNDLLKPQVRDQEASLLAWKEKYRELVRAIRQRAKPRELVLCEITPLTEDPSSPKNRVRNRLNSLAAEVAGEENCRFAGTGTAVFDAVERCRKMRQDYHVIPDTVHPVPPLGHTAIAKAMAAALQDEELAADFEKAIQSKVTGLAQPQPTVTYWLKPEVGCPADRESQVYRLTCFWNDGTEAKTAQTPEFSLEVPAGWTVTGTAIQGTEASFSISGVPSRLQTPVTIAAKAGEQVIRQTLQIPAPWRVVCGPDNAGAWTAERKYQPNQSVPFFEAALVAGKQFDEPFSAEGKTYPWQANTPSVDYTGGSDPNSVVPFSLTFGSQNDVLYAARWVCSDKSRPVQIQLSHQTFSATLGFEVWVNGRLVLTEDLNRSGKNKVTGRAELAAGWNCLLVRNDHLQWQRQYSCALLPVEGDNLDGLRYSVMPQPAAVTSK